jgi:hypothetical protein
MKTLQFTKPSGQPVLVNLAHFVYAEPAGDGSSCNVYLSSREMIKVAETLTVIQSLVGEYVVPEAGDEVALLPGDEVALLPDDARASRRRKPVNPVSEVKG